MQEQAIGKYIIKEHLGSGAFGDVYLGFDLVLEREAAIKVLDPMVAWDPEVVERFYQEAKVLAKLEHPRIAGVWEMAEENGQFYIAMQYIKGKTLEEIIKDQGHLSLESALEITSQIGEALQYAHEMGFIHRDVKPGNIIINERYGAVLTDFGLVKALSGTRLTRTGITMGTPEYMATEVINGHEATPESDQFSLACVLVEMISGTSPFAAPTPVASITKHIQGFIEFDKFEGLPDFLNLSITRALSNTPHKRFENVYAFVKNLSYENSKLKSSNKEIAYQVFLKNENITMPLQEETSKFLTDYSLPYPYKYNLPNTHVESKYWIKTFGSELPSIIKGVNIRDTANEYFEIFIIMGVFTNYNSTQISYKNIVNNFGRQYHNTIYPTRCIVRSFDNLGEDNIMQSIFVGNYSTLFEGQRHEISSVSKTIIMQSEIVFTRKNFLTYSSLYKSNNPVNHTGVEIPADDILPNPPKLIFDYLSNVDKLIMKFTSK